VAPGEVIVEVGYLHGNGSLADVDTFGVTDVRFGVNSEWEVDVLWSGVSHADTPAGSRSDAGDVALAAKYRIARNSDYAISAFWSVGVQETMPIGAALVGEWYLTPETTAFGMVQWVSDELIRGDERFQPAVGISHALNSEWSAFAEVFSDIAITGSGHETLTNLGVAWAGKSNLQLDMHWIQSVDDSSNWQVGIGVSWLLP
jgi:hypothetical protein